MPKPRITIVDKDDKLVGYQERDKMIPDDIYRVSALWITNSKGEILLAQRVFTKTHDPGKWGPAVAGTVDEGESYDQNIIKEADEELDLKDIKSTIGPKRFVNGHHKFFCQWYTLVVDEPLSFFKPRKEEVETIKWFASEELKAAFAKNPQDFLVGFPETMKLFCK